MNTFVEIELVPQTCGGCGVVFGMEKEHRKNLIDNNGSFYCPNGCIRRYVGETEAQKQQRLAEEATRKAERERERADKLQSQRDSSRRSHKRMRNRVRNGVCPCCNRQFQNLLQHMKTQHPDYGTGRSLRNIREHYGMTQAVLAEEIGVQVQHISLFERSKDVPVWAKDQIDAWVSEETT